MGVTLKEGEKMSDSRTRSNCLFVTSYVPATIIKRIQ